MATPTGSKYTNTITNTRFQEHAVLWKAGKTTRVFGIVSGWGNWNVPFCLVDLLSSMSGT